MILLKSELVFITLFLIVESQSNIDFYIRDQRFQKTKKRTKQVFFLFVRLGGPTWARTRDPQIMSLLL